MGLCGLFTCQRRVNRTDFNGLNWSSCSYLLPLILFFASARVGFVLFVRRGRFGTWVISFLVGGVGGGDSCHGLGVHLFQAILLGYTQVLSG